MSANKPVEANAHAEQSVDSGTNAVQAALGKQTPQGNESLDVVEKAALQQLENTLRTNLGNFELIGAALKAIQERKLYREKFKRFEDYCAEQWGLSDKYAYRLIKGYECVQELRKESPNGENLPMNESQVRPLLRLDTPEKRVKAWKQAIIAAKGKRVTADVVEGVVNKMVGKPGKPEPIPSKTTNPGTTSSPTEQKLKQIAKLVTKTLKKTSGWTVTDLTKVLEKIQNLLKANKTQ